VKTFGTNLEWMQNPGILAMSSVVVASNPIEARHLQKFPMSSTSP
jgi:hypothetical protein